MQPQFVPMTKTGYQKIQQEIADLKKTRPSLIKALADARALGDLSENAEYSAAKRDLRRMEGRLRYLERQINYSKIVENADRSKLTSAATSLSDFWMTTSPSLTKSWVNTKPTWPSKKFLINLR